MKKQELIKRIKPTYIINYIFKYIKDNNLKLKLFIYSKYFQNKLNIKLIDYKEKYIDSIGFDINKYLHRKDESDNLIDKYNNFLLKNNFNKKEFENIFSEVIIKRINENKGNLKKLIDMESPFFDIISKTKIFENNYIIYISQNIIDKY